MSFRPAVTALSEAALKAALAAAYERWMQWCVCLNVTEGVSLQEFGEALHWMHDRECSALHSEDRAHMERVLCNILESEQWLMAHRTGHTCGQCAACHVPPLQQAAKPSNTALHMPVQFPIQLVRGGRCQSETAASAIPQLWQMQPQI